ncbi:YwiC-like family protein [Neobacillus sp. PS3-40]|uniref:YwiC-like family protein n=1 Tax=Neobacillus sp. PS3-40 TaxID=3070679 RepID=UPI0027E1F9EA|nr:YwiC-like family protein [Neobacillus sp. PS3-40]WML43363.1 YwiC-like family protein [Neobacillus sp. PS3-40]
MKLFLPKQHGAWAMAIIPFWLGVVEGGFVWEHIPFFIGWLFLYLSTYPMLLLFKKKKLMFYSKWTAIYLVPAILILLFPLAKNFSIIYFGLLMIPFFIINAFYSSQNNDRSLMNDFSAIFAFSIVSLGSSFLGNGIVTAEAILIFFSSVLFFVGSTFYVKTMIREKNNPQFKWISWAFHVLIPIVWFVLGYWIVALAFIPSMLRAIGFYGKTLSAKKVGIYEIVNATLFFCMMTIQLLIK